MKKDKHTLQTSVIICVRCGEERIVKFIMTFLLLMFLLLSGGSARVVEDFQTECGHFFAHNISPTVLTGYQYRHICQSRNNHYYYATLYDTNNKIPVYSAYVFKACESCKRQNKWYIEPQLDDEHAEPNMAEEQRMSENQSSNTDYESSGFNKGHLAPVCHASSQQCACATFTLTNAAPQYGSFNKRWYHRVEKSMKNIVNTVCTDNTAHIVTGVVPGTVYINNRVNVPEYFWSAYCCNTTGRRLVSGGVIGDNVRLVTPDNLRPRTVEQLDGHLSLHYQQNFRVFDNNCRFAPYVPVVNEDSFITPRRRGNQSLRKIRISESRKLFRLIRKATNNDK